MLGKVLAVMHLCRIFVIDTFRSAECTYISAVVADKLSCVIW